MISVKSIKIIIKNKLNFKANPLKNIKKRYNAPSTVLNFHQICSNGTQTQHAPSNNYNHTRPCPCLHWHVPHSKCRAREIIFSLKSRFPLFCNFSSNLNQSNVTLLPKHFKIIIIIPSFLKKKNQIMQNNWYLVFKKITWS